VDAVCATLERRAGIGLRADWQSERDVRRGKLDKFRPGGVLGIEGGGCVSEPDPALKGTA